MKITGGWHADYPAAVPDTELTYTISSWGNRDPRTTTFPRPEPDEVVCEPSRALIAQRRRVREQLVSYTVMADALEYMEYRQSTDEEKTRRRPRPWIAMGGRGAMDRMAYLMPPDDSSTWDSDLDEHAIPRYPMKKRAREGEGI